MPDATDKPGKGLLGWLGRQVGYVKQAVKTDVTALPAPKTVFREEHVEEREMPDDPKVKLRRTVIDEVIVDANANSKKGSA